jgi:hypothetical protein
MVGTSPTFQAVNPLGDWNRMNGRASDFHDEIDTRICDLLMDGVSYER